MASNRHKLNPSKSEVSIGAPPSGVAVYLTTVGLPSHLVILKFDQLGPSQPWSRQLLCSLTMTVHASQLVRVCVCQLRRIKTIRKFIPTSAAVIFVNHSFIVFRVDYYNSGSTDVSARSDSQC